MHRKILIAVTIALFAIAASAEAAGDAAAGKAKSAGCAGCHGAKGEGKDKVGPIAGMKEDKFVQAMKDYKSGKRPDPVMKGLTASMSDADMANLAAYYATLK